MKEISGKVALLAQSMMASGTIGKKLIPNSLAIALTTSVGPAIREVPESTIPYDNPENSLSPALMEFKATGQ